MPVDQVVLLTVKSYDVVHSWWIPQLGGKIQAIPGRTNHIWFKADRAGTYYGQCAEFCGLYHEAMHARVIVTDDADYRTYTTRTAASDLGRAEFQGSCATCHGMQGQGGYGPNLAHDPLLTQAASLASVVRNGGVKMPAVGDSWTKAQMTALDPLREVEDLQGSEREWRLDPKRCIRCDVEERQGRELARHARSQAHRDLVHLHLARLLRRRRHRRAA